jgi:hypothetical protein
MQRLQAKAEQEDKQAKQLVGGVVRPTPKDPLPLPPSDAVTRDSARKAVSEGRQGVVFGLTRCADLCLSSVYLRRVLTLHLS